MELLSRHSLRACNTLGFDCTAEFFAEAGSEEALQALLAQARARGMPLTVLGGGSNVVLGDTLPGLVIRMAVPGRELVGIDGDSVLLRVGAGENWHELVRYTLLQGWCGLENLSLIPGAVGAAPIQNIGAYGVELAEHFVELSACRVTDGQPRVFSLADCRFGYRDSVFKHECRDEYVITAVTLRLSRDGAVRTGYGELVRTLEAAGVTDPTPRDVSEAVIRIRSEKLPDPREIGNAGSFFKNPVVTADQHARIARCEPDLVAYPQPDGGYKLAAGWLIDRCGWKGRREGSVGVHDRQALVLVHHGGGRARQLLELAGRICADVEERFGVALEIEPRVYAV